MRPPNSSSGRGTVAERTRCVTSEAGNENKLYLREYGADEERPACREDWRRGEWGGGTRSRLPQVDRSPSRRSPYLTRDDEPSPAPDERGRSASAGAHHRARPRPLRYQSLERDYDRSYAPPPPPEDDYYRREPPPLFLGELQSQNSDLQRELGNLKKELELTNQKLGSSMHSIKTFWSPELKKERALRKEESAKYSLINDQLKLLNQENQKQAMLVRQLEEELRLRMRQPAPEMQQQLEALFAENEHLQREIAILRDTIKELELRIETQKQTLQARDESIKKLLEMLQNKGMGKEEERQMFQQMQAMAQKQLDEFRLEIQRRDQEILAMAAKMKALEEQHQDYQRHIAVLKESLCAKEEHYSMLQTDVEELKARLDEKSRMVEKKTAAALAAAHELAEFRDHSEIKDRKINVLQRKIVFLVVMCVAVTWGNPAPASVDSGSAAGKEPLVYTLSKRVGNTTIAESLATAAKGAVAGSSGSN